MKRRYDKPLTAEELAQRPDDEIDTSDIPVLDEAFWSSAVVSEPRTKSIVSLRLSDEVINHFRTEFPKGYTSRMATVLSAYVAAQKSR